MATLKFNGGVCALLCDHCYRIIATSSDIPDEAFTKLSHLYFCSSVCMANYGAGCDKNVTIIKPKSDAKVR
jgi:hypothetical protein